MNEFDTCDGCSSNSNLGYTKSQKFGRRKNNSLTNRNMYSLNFNSLSCLVLGFFIITTCVSSTVAQNLKLNVENIVNSLDILKPGRTEPVALHWGIADTSAVVGKMFNYVIPSDAFKGNIISYKVSIKMNDDESHVDYFK